MFPQLNHQIWTSLDWTKQTTTQVINRRHISFNLLRSVNAKHSIRHSLLSTLKHIFHKKSALQYEMLLQRQSSLISLHLWRPPPFPQIDIIGDVAIVWRVRGKIIRSFLCNIVCNNCAQCDAHIYEQTNSSLDWVLSHWAHFTVIHLCIVYYCVLYAWLLRFVTRWGGPGGIEAYP